MTIPAVPLVTGTAAVINPEFQLRVPALPTDAATAVHDFIDLLVPLASPGTTFNDFTIFAQDGVGGIAVPIKTVSVGATGTNASSAHKKAWQQTFSFRATDFTTYKLVLLDFPVDLGEDRRVNLSGSAIHMAVLNYIRAGITWFASRGGGRPDVFLQYAATLNEKLRRSYRMN